MVKLERIVNLINGLTEYEILDEHNQFFESWVVGKNDEISVDVLIVKINENKYLIQVEEEIQSESIKIVHEVNSFITTTKQCVVTTLEESKEIAIKLVKNIFI